MDTYYLHSNRKHTYVCMYLVSLHLNHTFLFYGIFYRFTVACLDNYRCPYNNAPDIHNRQIILEDASDLIRSIMLAYMHIINLLTTNTTRIIVVTDALEVFITLLASFSLMFATIRLISRYTTMLSITNYSKSNYEHKIEALHIYLQVSYI